LAALKWYRLFSRDDRSNNWLFHSSEPVYVKEKYKSFVCLECGKLDEFSALDLDLDKDIVYKSKWDISHSLDGIMCFSKRMYDLCIKFEVKGLSFKPIGSTGFYVVLPGEFIDVDMDKSGFEYYGGQCKTCGRWRESIIGPLLESMNFADKTANFCCPSVLRESIQGRDFIFCVDNLVLQMLKNEEIKGLEYVDY
jgi:hypothetical protein